MYTIALTGRLEQLRLKSLYNMSKREAKSPYRMTRCVAKSLEDSLDKCVMQVITKRLDPQAALGTMDALAKTLYSRVAHV